MVAIIIMTMTTVVVHDDGREGGRGDHHEDDDGQHPHTGHLAEPRCLLLMLAITTRSARMPAGGLSQQSCLPHGTQNRLAVHQ